MKKGTVAATAAFVGGVVSAVGLAGARHISGPKRPGLDYGFTPFEVGADAVDVRFEASDGVRLAGWWLDRPEAQQVVICCHGHRGSKADLLGLGPGLWRAGLAVLMFDFRGNGESDDGPQSLAHYEQRDLEAAIDWVAQTRPDAEICLAGFSMGAATALLVAARDDRVSRVLADSSFADMRGVVSSSARHLHLPAVPVVALVDQATRWRYGYRFGDVVPVDAVPAISPRQLLLWHGTADELIPVEHAHRLLAASGGNAELRLAEGAGHCGAYFADRPGYLATAVDFFTRPLDGKSAPGRHLG